MVLLKRRVIKNALYITSGRIIYYCFKLKNRNLLILKNQFTIGDLNGLILVNIGGEEKLIAPMNGAAEETRYYVRYDNLYEILHEAHIPTDHGNRNRIVYAAKSKYKNVNIEAINIYLKLWSHVKKSSMPKEVLPLNLLYTPK